MVSAALLALTTTRAGAQELNARMAVTNSVTAPGYQPLVWLSSGGSLVFKNPDSIGSNGWTTMGISGIDENLAGVSWTSSNTPRQRVFYTKGGFLHQLTYDNNAASDAQLSGLAGFTFQSYLAAATYAGGGNTQYLDVAVAAINTSNSVRLCSFHGTVNQAPSPTWCTSTDTLPSNDVSDVVGVSLGGTTAPRFFFVDVNQRLGALVPQATLGTYVWTTLNSPDANPLRRSLWAAESEAGGSYQIAVVSWDATSDHAWLGNLPSGGSTVTWTALPALPANEAMLYNAAVSGTKYVTGLSTHTLVSLVDFDGRVNTIASTNGVWPGTWQPPVLPGGGEYFLSVGTATSTASSPQNPRIFLTGGETGGTSLIEYQVGAVPALRDHVRVGLGDGIALPAPANESSARIGPHLGIASAMARTSTVAQMQLAQTGPSASGWDLPYNVTALPPLNAGYSTSISDATTFSGGSDGRFTNRFLHYSEMQGDLSPTCSFAPDTGPNSRVVYRRDVSVGAIASMTLGSAGLWVVEANVNGRLDHPGLGVTFDPYGFTLPTAHVLYDFYPQGSGKTLRYWSLMPNGTANAPIDVTSAFSSDGGDAVVAVGAGQAVYGYTSDGTPSFPWGHVCKLTAGRAPTPGECGAIAGGSATPVPADSKFIYFGAPQGTQQQQSCQALPSGYYKCFMPEQSIALAADPVNPSTFYVAYQAYDPSSPGAKDLSVYFTKAANSFTAWSPPIRVHARVFGDQFNYINPSITVDASGTIVITYSAIHSTEDSSDQTGAASVYAVWWSGDGAPWTAAAGNPYSSWNASALPYHCVRRMSWLGEYREGAALAGRAYQVYPYSTGSTQNTTQQRGKFFSRWAM